MNNNIENKDKLADEVVAAVAAAANGRVIKQTDIDPQVNLLSIVKKLSRNRKKG